MAMKRIFWHFKVSKEFYTTYSIQHIIGVLTLMLRFVDDVTVRSFCSVFWVLSEYSRVPNKRGGDENNRGVGNGSMNNNRGGACWRNRK